MKKLVLALFIILGSISIVAADTIYLRDGRTVRGTLLGFINGRFVVRVENRYATQSTEVARNRTNEGEIQYFRPNEVDHIEIDGRNLDEARLETRSVQVTLDSNWIDSGVDLRRGQKVQVNASGVIMAGRNRITPDGLRSTDPTAPLPRTMASFTNEPPMSNSSLHHSIAVGTGRFSPDTFFTLGHLHRIQPIARKIKVLSAIISLFHPTFVFLFQSSPPYVSALLTHLRSA